VSLTNLLLKIKGKIYLLVRNWNIETNNIQNLKQGGQYIFLRISEFEFQKSLFAPA